MSELKKLLHLGCGPAERKDVVFDTFKRPDWEHIRVDIDMQYHPDVCTDIRTLEGIEDNSVEGVYSSHVLEHLHDSDVDMAIISMWRVMKPGALGGILVPDFESVMAVAIYDGFDSWLYNSPAGPIHVLDVLYGYRPWTKNNPHQQHRTAFSKVSLKRRLGAWFIIKDIFTPPQYNLVAIFQKEEPCIK